LDVVFVLNTTYTLPTITVYESAIFPDYILCGKEITSDPLGIESTLDTTFTVIGDDCISYFGEKDSIESWIVQE
jgi:hypothetical protein